MLTRSIGQAVKTPPSHGGNRGSIPLLTVGRMPDIQVSFFFFGKRKALRQGTFTGYRVLKAAVSGQIERSRCFFEKERQKMTLLQLRYVTTAAQCSSMNEAAKMLFVSQPNLSGAVRELENEIGFQIFRRTSKGVIPTPQGEEFLGYARQLLEQYQLIEDRFVRRTGEKKKFSVSMQHYSFAVKAFVELVRQFGMDEYEFAVYETKTQEVILDVRNFKSELGILYQNAFNRAALEKLFRENYLEFHPLFSCETYVYLWKGHPLAGRPRISIEELKEYPCLMFDQGSNNSFFLAEEMMSTYDYKRSIRANDRATMLNLMVGLNGYTLCSGKICEELNGDEYRAVPLKETEEIVIGYAQRKGMDLSPLAQQYLEEIKKTI